MTEPASRDELWVFWLGLCALAVLVPGLWGENLAALVFGTLGGILSWRLRFGRPAGDNVFREAYRWAAVAVVAFVLVATFSTNPAYPRGTDYQGGHFTDPNHPELDGP